MLPRAGGVLDQEPEWIERMEVVTNALRKRAELDRVHTSTRGKKARA